MRPLVLSLATFALAMVLAGSCAVRKLEEALLIPAGASADERVVRVERGVQVDTVVGQLAKAGLLSRPAWVRFYADHLRQAAAVRPGEYALSRDLSAIQQIERIVEGAVVTYTVNLTPGVTAEEAVERFADAGVAKVEALKPLLTDRAFLTEIGIPAESVEGYLFPDPYTVPKGLPARALVTNLVARHRAVVRSTSLEPDPNDPLDEYQRMILASLVQKSAVVPREWRLFAALLRNRLRVGLPLEVPAADAYGERRTANGEKNRWSTRRAGLPPTPICNPGVEALVSVVRPARSDARYMVARSNGTHVFCKDRECYRAAIRRWKMGLPPVAPGIPLGPDGLPLPPSPPDASVDASLPSVGQVPSLDAGGLGTTEAVEDEPEGQGDLVAEPPPVIRPEEWGSPPEEVSPEPEEPEGDPVRPVPSERSPRTPPIDPPPPPKVPRPRPFPPPTDRPEPESEPPEGVPAHTTPSLKR